MKTLQNNFTTPEQSKRLLELGFPADSADMVYWKQFMYPRIIEGGTYTSSQKYIKDYKAPCWSVGRLIEILATCCERPELIIYRQYAIADLVDYCMRTFANCVRLKIIDFSKLEE